MTTQEQINEYMTLGRLYDQLSDQAFSHGRLEAGTYFGNEAITAYSRAEELSLAQDEKR